MSERVLVCGSRDWSDPMAIQLTLERLDAVHGIEAVIHGDCRGADRAAGQWARDTRWVSLLVFPADWERYGRRAGPIRNRQMITEGQPTMVLAFHPDLENSRGTKDMVRAAKDAGLPVYLFDANGKSGKL